jgi:FKBP-type peptidyl-prolyl cis-trans isomerase SlyD
MKIGKNSVVSMEYTLKDDAGEVVDSSEGSEPLTYLHGHGQIVAGLERALDGKVKGDKVTVTVSPKDGYGERNDKKVMQIERSRLPGEMKPEVGMQLAAEGPGGEVVPLWITKIAGDDITLDGNHPMAGKALHFAVEIKDIREATKQELDHGHVHGAHGHDH